MSDRPPYVLPTMADVRAIPWNGYNVVSTFAGGGGSSTGYRMAGYRVLLASEFVPAALDTYRANAAPYTQTDARDVREVTGADLLDRLSLDVGDLDVLDGSPPCASFSTSGKRSAGWGQVKTYSDTSQRTDDLFYEFTRLLREMQPRVFVAENVSGLVKGSAKGYFKAILTEMKATGYRVSARLLNAARLGVPQSRQRLIFVGVRNDLGIAPVHPAPLPFLRPLTDALPDLLAYETEDRRSGARTFDVQREPAASILVGHHGSSVSWDHKVASREALTHDPETGAKIALAGYAVSAEWHRLVYGETGRYLNLVRPDPRKPSPTVTALGGSNPGTASVTHPLSPRKFTIAELRAICSFPPDYVLTGTYAQRWERLGRSVPPLMMAAVAATVRDEVLARSAVGAR